jgi:hypothetical protein
MFYHCEDVGVAKCYSDVLSVATVGVGLFFGCFTPTVV